MSKNKKYLYNYVNKLIDTLFFYIYNNYINMEGGDKMREMENINVTNVNSEEKRKAMFMLKSKGTDLSTAIKKLVKQYADEFDKKNSK